MNLPIKITPDSIRDAIIEIKYLSPIPFEVLVGFIFNALDDSYKYTNKPNTLNTNQQIAVQQNLVEFQLGVQNLFYTDTIKLDIRPNSLIFNCLNGYKGWNNYLAEIDKTLTQISKIKEIEKFNRIGVRYISEYPKTDITNCTKFSFTFGIPEIVSDTYIFRTEFMSSGFRVILTLQHQTPVLTGKLNNNIAETKPISTIDIDVIADNLSIESYSELLILIDQIHSTEKELFFNIMDEGYLKTLNPVYE